MDQNQNAESTKNNDIPRRTPAKKKPEQAKMRLEEVEA
jgi:hypothetical protein